MYTIDDSLLTLKVTEPENQTSPYYLPGEPYYQQFTASVMTDVDETYGIDLTQFYLRLTHPRWVTPRNEKKTSLYKLTEEDVDENSFNVNLYTSSPSLADKDYAETTVTIELLYEESVVAEDEFEVKADYGTILKE